MGESCTYIHPNSHGHTAIDSDNADFFNQLDQCVAQASSNIQKELGADQDEDDTASNKQEKERAPTRALVIIGTGLTAK